jgi:hypothetical protein
MFGLSSSGKDQIASIVEELFDNIALQLIGAIPEIKGKKSLIISSRQNYGLPELFVQAMANKPLNSIEADSLKSFLSSANGYINTLKSKAKTNIAERIDALARDSKLKNTKMTDQEVKDIVSDEMGKAKSHMKSIAEAEGTKVRNLGTLMNISRLSSQVGDDDPTVYFIVVRDNVTCKECIRLHLNPDGTPRLWKFSDLSYAYHKRGQDFPSIAGLHNWCRCTLTYLPKNWGFDKKGHIKYISDGHDEYNKKKK